MRGILLLFLLCLASLALAQPAGDSTVHSYVFTVGSGRILTGESNLQSFTDSHPISGQMETSWIRNTAARWRDCNCLVRNGAALKVTSFGDSRLGQSFSLLAFTEPVLLHRPRWQFTLRGGAGLAYLNKVYDALQNPDNTFYSAPLSFELTLGPRLVYSANTHWQVGLQGQLNHISNGGRRDPNDGMNYTSASAWIQYTPGEHELVTFGRSKFSGPRWLRVIHLFAFPRTLAADATGPEQTRLVSGVNAGLLRALGRQSAIGVGAESYYDGLQSLKRERYAIAADDFISSILIQHQLTLGRLVFAQQMAWYLNAHPGSRFRTFQRYFLQYRVHEKWQAGISLKAHADQSDYFSLALSRIW